MAMSDLMEDDLEECLLEEAEDVFYDGVSSRFPEIMAAGTHSPGGPNGIIRSQSFAGFSTLQERRSRCNSFMGNSVVQRKVQSKAKRPHLSKSSSSSSSREPQPKRLEEVYCTLKQGLDEYLEVHQSELDKFTSLMKDMKRNSRLGVLYDLDKQIKTIERYMRRLEFHISKVDELFEGFCIQRRLRDGASKMKQAFSSSPSSKSTRESLAEVNRRYKEYTENMCTFEGELENLLGEFHIKMRGLAGFARLCPGDQYELGSVSTAVDVLPGLADKPDLLSLWSECSGGCGGLFHTTLDRVLTHLHRCLTHTLPDTLPLSPDTVIRLVVSEMVDRSELASPVAGSASALAQDVLTVFQFHRYAAENRVDDMQEHLQQLAAEVVLAETLSSGDSERSLQELEKVCVSALRPCASTLAAVAALLTSEDTHLSKAAMSFLTSASAHTLFRSKAVEWYTQALSEVGVHTQRAACAALSCLQATESIGAMVTLCHSADEELRHLAIKTLLTFGEEGRLAYEQLDMVSREMIRLGTRRSTAVTTAF
ncbi:rho family-interacting cell polarization regulator 2 [Alosa pseudoharengus]|uniref:rho family-interacting cell polarization regulator 2 n=1 Tax=Alosa pseudoharengus TaxID=34774 RepID=UPI003F8927A7